MIPLLVLVILAAVYLAMAVKIIPENERAVVFRLGALLPEPKGPGLVMVLAPLDRVVRVSIAEQKVAIPAQDVTTRDAMTRRVAGEVVFRVIDPVRAVSEVVDYRESIATMASNAIARTCQTVDADEIGAQAAAIGDGVKKEIDEAANRLGMQVSQVNVVA